MISFKEFLFEEQVTKKVSATEKVHDLDHLLFHHGHDGMLHTGNMLDAVHKLSLGKSSDGDLISHHGGLPVTFGNEPTSGKYFVAHNPALPNYSPLDIETNHGHEPEIKEKLKASFDHLHKILPTNGGMYDGKVFTKKDVKTKDDTTSIKTPTRTYSIPSNTATGKQLKNAQVGVSVDAYHDGKEFQPITDKEHNRLKNDPDVAKINPIAKGNPKNYTPDDQLNFP